MNKKKELLKIKKKAIILASTLALSGILCGCQEEMANDVGNIDILETTDEENGYSLRNGVTQRLYVNGEDFSLIVNYQSGSEKWQINANKKLYIEIKTVNLPDNLEVYIDNIHMDTSIVSTKAIFDGILQDTMDDRIHNSIILGFPISDTNSYFGINEIEGQNQTFIEGYYSGCNGYTSGEIKQKRYLESDFLGKGVWGNKVDSVIDLLIVDKKTGKVIRQVSVDTSLIVEANDKVTFKDGDYLITYDYDKNGSRSEYKKEMIK